MSFRGSLANLFVTCLDEQFSSLRVMSSWVTWVFTLGLTDLEFVFHRSRPKKLLPGMSVGFTHMNRSLAPKEMLLLVVTGQSLLKTFCPIAGDPILTKEHGDQDGQEGQFDARVLYSSADRRFRKWEDVVWDSFACSYEDHPGTRQDESDVSTGCRAPRACGGPTGLVC